MITPRMLSEAHAEHHARYGGDSTDYFGPLYIHREFSVPIERALRQVFFGPTEFGVMGFHFDADRRNLYLFQFHWGTSHETFARSLRDLIDAGIDAVFPQKVQDRSSELDQLLDLVQGGTPDHRQGQELLHRLSDELVEQREVVKQVYLQLVFNGDPDEATRSAVLGHLVEDLFKKQYLLQRFFGRPVPLTVVPVSARVGHGTGEGNKVVHEFVVALRDALEIEGPADERMHVGFVPLMELHRMYAAMGFKFFDRNVRAALGKGTGPNRSLTESLHAISVTKDLDPEAFAFHHNGVTLAVERFEQEDGQYRLVEPRLLNGAQTVSTLHRFLSQEKKATVDKTRLAAMQVQCRVIVNASRDFVTHVTINNNRQNPVKPANLRAHDSIQLELQDWLRAKAGFYYERQEGAFGALTEDDLERLGILHPKPITLPRLAQTFLALNGSVDKLGRMREVFENQAEYERVFNSRRLSARVTEVIVCYKMQLRLRRLLQEILSKGAEKYAYIFRARNLVWALLCQAFLNDKDRDEIAAIHGDDLTATKGFTDDMAWLVSQRVRHIMGAALGDEPYASKLAAEKYAVLGTRGTFSACMKVAADRYDWSKRNLP
jgi:hypothetical protein